MKPAARKPFKVRAGNSHLTVSPWTHPATGAERWRFAYRPAPGRPWKYLTFKTKAAAQVAAEQKLEALAAGTNTLAELPTARRRWLEELAAIVPESEQTRVLDFARAMAASADLAAAVSRFIASKTSKAGEKTPHMERLGSVLQQFAQAFNGRHVSDIHLPDLQKWFDQRTAGRGWKRRKDIRAALVQFYRWARREGIAGPEAVTVAERLAEIGGEHGERRILTMEEFRRVHDAISDSARAWLALGCFAGLRPEEIAPSTSKRSAKRGLRCEEIDWQFNVIRLPACVSKVGLPRIVPLSAACRAGLEWAGIRPGMTGPVCLTNPSQSKELARLAKAIFKGPWPKDICRHSYGSYRNACIRDLGKLAEEMGTSIAMLHRHYHNPRSEEEGKSWFDLRPGALPVLICSDENGTSSATASSVAI